MELSTGTNYVTRLKMIEKGAGEAELKIKHDGYTPFHLNCLAILYCVVLLVVAISLQL